MESNLRRSNRRNMGVFPDRFGDPVPHSDGRKPAQLPVQRREKQLGVNEQRASGNVRHIPLNEDARSMKSGSSTSSSVRRRLREVELQEAEQIARLAAEKDALAKKQIEREENLVRLRAEVERENIEDDLIEFSDDGMDMEDMAEPTHKGHGQSIGVDVEKWVRHGAMGGNIMASAEERFDGGLASIPEERRAPEEHKSRTGGLQAPGKGEFTPQSVQHVQNNFNNTKTAEEDSVSRLAEVLTKALSIKTTMNDSHYLARQTIGRTKLPEFSGDPTEWPTFISQFISSSEECRFSKSEDLIRLRGALKGKAKECVQSLLVSPENLQEVLDTLEINFGRKDQIIWSLIEKAKRVATPREDDFGTLLTYTNAIANMCATMKTLGAKVHLQNPQLLRDLLEKLPTTMKYDWAKHSAGNEDVTLEDFCSWLKKITQAMGSSAAFYTENKQKRREQGFVVQDDRKMFCENCEITGHCIQECRKFKKLSHDAKQKIVIQKRLCFCCLKKGHPSKLCKSSKKCEIDGCQKYHHPLLHKANSLEAKSKLNEQAHMVEVAAEKSDTEESETEESFAANDKAAMLAFLPVKVAGLNGQWIDAFVGLDDGTTSTWIETDLQEELGIKGKKDPVKVSMIGETVKNIQESERVSFQIRGAWENSRIFTIKGARTIDDIGLGEQTLDISKLAVTYPYLDGLPVVSYKNAKPRILIGQADKLLSLARKYSHGKENEPVAFKTWLGWACSGKFGSTRGESACIIKEMDETLHQLVKESFSIDSFSVKELADGSRSKEDRKAEVIMQQTTKRVGDQFETGILWRDTHVEMPNSYAYALSRLNSQEKKMDKDPAFAKAMSEKIQEYVHKGYIKKLEPAEVSRSSKEWYLPYFGVFNPNKPGKMRLVFDAAAKCQGVSLNSKVLQGPDYLNPLLAVIWKFRQRQIAFGADITDMYHRIRIIEDDLPAQRFLWRGMSREGRPDVYQINVMIFGAACSPASAHFVKNLNAEEWKEEFPEACLAIHNNFYMDDYLDSVDSVDHAIKKIAEVIEVNKRGGFTLCKWNCNSKEVLKSVPADLRAEGLKEVDLEKVVLPSGRTLGVWWNANEDTFCFQLNLHKVPAGVRSGVSYPTKRQALTLVMSVFDPLGIIAHIMVKAKILLQDVWRSEIHWDDEIPKNLQDRWKLWLDELKLVEAIRIPRCYSLNIPVASTIQLHIFNDASTKAYASAAYFRVVTDDHVDVSFVAAKTRVAPLKEMSMPRLELQAALVGSRLAKSIKDNHTIEINEVFMWTDSSTVIHWIKSESKRFKQFVSHRIGEILELTESRQWIWIPSKENVADDATRDGEFSDVSTCSRWLYGPEFLKQQKLPIPFSGAPMVNNEELELAKESAHLLTEPFRVIKFERHSSYLKLVRIVCWIRRWRLDAERGVTFSVDEMEKAEVALARLAQKESYATEFRDLERDHPIQQNSKIWKLIPYLGEGYEVAGKKVKILRMKGRLGNAKFLPYHTRNPIILDSHHRFTLLLIDYYHRMYDHINGGSAFNSIREKYWITHLGSALKKVQFGCQVCKNLRAVPQVPMMADLPEARVTPHVRPFTFTGMDVFGPFNVVVKRSVVKRYGLLFTCMTTRAVHIEKLDNLTTDSCIMAIDRMSSIRGKPEEVFCDNGTNFRGAERELAQYLDEEKTIAETGIRGIKFRFNPPAAPHFGGVWERLVRSVKLAMGATVKLRKLHDEALNTVFHQAAFMVNSRPLTQVAVDPKNPVALTPNHFLFGPQYKPNLSELVFTDEDLHLRRHWRFVQRLTDHFWQRWIKEYLPTLQRRVKWQQEKRNVQVGDICVMVETDLPRVMWKLGRITSVHPGKDGKVRSVEVLSNGSRYLRPVAKIAVLDVRKDNDDSQ